MITSQVIKYIFNIFVLYFHVLYLLLKGIERLIKELKSWAIGITKIIGYNHVDFVSAKNADKLVYTKIIDFLDRYN